MRWNSTLGILGVTLTVLGCCMPGCSGTTNPGAVTSGAGEPEKAGPWFEDLGESLNLQPEELDVLVRFAGAAYRVELDRHAPLPQKLANDQAVRIVFLDVSNGEDFPTTAMGVGLGIQAAIERAATAARRLSDAPGYAILKLDIVDHVELLEQLDQEHLIPTELGTFGLAFPRPSERVIAPEEIVLRNLVDRSTFNYADLLNKLLREEHQSPVAEDAVISTIPLPATVEAATTPEIDAPNSLHRFRVVSVAFDGQQSSLLLRGHAVFEAPIPADQLLAAATAAGQYLSRIVEEDGRFLYLYHADSGEIGPGYNFLRHAGTAYAMFELYEINRDPDLLASGEKALNYLLGFLQPGIDEDGVEIADTLCLVDDTDEVKLGGNGLLTLALAKHAAVTGQNEHAETIRKLCKWMQATQDESGDFTVHKQIYSEGDVSSFRSDYYPGEALFGLVRAYELLQDPALLDAAEKGALFQIADQTLDPDVPVIHDHWLLYALKELSLYRPRPEFVEHSQRIADAIVESQMQGHAPDDLNGAFAYMPDGNSTATRLEGLAAAVELLRSEGKLQEAARLEQSIENGLSFLLQLQYRPAEVLYLAEPPFVLGSIRDGLTRHSVRIDTVQHAISAFLGSYRLKTSSNPK